MRTLCVLLVAVLLLAGCGQREDGDVSPPQGAQTDPTTLTTPTTASQQPSPDSAPDPAASSPEDGGESAESEAETEPLTLRITIPEGYTLARIGMELEEQGICTAADFILAAQTGDYSEYELVAAQLPNENRCFNLEGYLYPDTYEIYRTEPPDTIIRRFLAHFEQVMDPEIRAAIAASGYTVDEILTLASIIEKEAFGPEEMQNISSVLHNRLAIGMQLQCDVTLAYVEGAIKPFIEGDKDRYSSYYNTYKCPALPAGAICNPSLPAVRAALNPAETEYLFFVTDGEQRYHYAVTWEEHKENVAAAGIEPAGE